MADVTGIRRTAAALVAAAVGTAAAGTTPAVAAPHAPRATTRVTVTAAKPSEFRFKLSASTVKRGTVVFRVVNRGRLTHDFAIHGKRTKLLAPGKSAVLRVVFAKAGKYPYLCTVAGHAAAGMKGVLRVR